MTVAHLLLVANLFGGTPDAGELRPEADLPTVPTPPPLEAFVAAMESLAPVLVKRHGHNVLAAKDGIRADALVRWFSSSVALTSPDAPAPGQVSLARLGAEIKAMKGPVFQYLLGVAYQLQFFYPGRAPTVVRDGKLLVMQIAEAYLVTFAPKGGSYVVRKIETIPYGGP